MVTASFLDKSRPDAKPPGERVGAQGGRGPPRGEGDAPGIEPASDYALGEICYGNVHGIARNARALGAQEVYTMSLCAYAPYSPDLDMFEIQPTVDPEELAQVVVWAFSDRRVNIKTLINVLGKEYTARLVADYIDTVTPPATQDVLAMCRKRANELNKRAFIEFSFMRVEDKTALTGPFTRELVGAAAWYGGVFRPAFI